MKMVDRRCPRCNQIVRGREEVVSVQRLDEDKKITECPSCLTAIRLENTTDDLGEHWYFDFVTTPPGW